MIKNFADIAFTESVKEQQKLYGSREKYARIESVERGTELTFAEADFINERDGFYMATVSESNFPYVQFRGGEKGFLKTLNSKTLGFADFRGNLQYISVGNLSVNNRAALILMDYANRQRLKIWAQIEIINAADAPELVEKLVVPGYKAKIERAMLLHVTAFDWNCPQHITPRYTETEIRTVVQPLLTKIEKLEAELETYKRKAN